MKTLYSIWNYSLCVFSGIECGDIPLQSSSNRSVPRVSVLSREVGGRASFSCQNGYGLRGPSETTCLSSGEWAQPFPTCTGTFCNDVSVEFRLKISQKSLSSLQKFNVKILARRQTGMHKAPHLIVLAMSFNSIAIQSI